MNETLWHLKALALGIGKKAMTNRKALGSERAQLVVGDFQDLKLSLWENPPEPHLNFSMSR
jgi:hypothetical protein